METKMRKTFLPDLIVIAVSLIWMPFASCTDTDSDIRTFKEKMQFQGVSGGQYFDQLAGVEGKVEYKAFHPDKYKDNPDIVCIEVDVVRSPNSRYKNFKVQYLMNRRMQNMELGYCELNGKPVPLLEFGIALSDMLLESTGMKF